MRDKHLDCPLKVYDDGFYDAFTSVSKYVVKSKSVLGNGSLIACLSNIGDILRMDFDIWGCNLRDTPSGKCSFSTWTNGEEKLMQ